MVMKGMRCMDSFEVWFILIGPGSFHPGIIFHDIKVIVLVGVAGDAEVHPKLAEVAVDEGRLPRFDFKADAALVMTVARRSDLQLTGIFLTMSSKMLPKIA